MKQLRKACRICSTASLLVPTLLALFVLFGGQAAAAAQEEQREPISKRLSLRLHLSPETQSPLGFVVTGLTAEEQSTLKSAELSQQQLQEIMQIAVGAKEGERANPGLAGKYEFLSGGVLFQPRYPPMAGVSYELRFAPAKLPQKIRPEESDPFSRTIAVPETESAPTNVAKVFPSGDELPENLLKFYVHFSGPMSVGDSYQYVKLFDISRSGQLREVELPFLTLEQELWDQDGTRLTLLFDPGRIKRGLKPREEVGPSLEEGKTYEFVISSSWPDAHGKPLEKEHRKRFRVLAHDDIQPNHENWQLEIPAGGGKSPLRVEFAEPLDNAMLERVIHVQRVGDQVGESVEEEPADVSGEVEILNGETNWNFTPTEAWKPGTYQLVIETTLEDRSGNSIGRPFEVDIFNQVDRGATRDFVRRKFVIEE